MLDLISSKCGLWDSFPSLFGHSQVLLTIVLLEMSKCGMLILKKVAFLVL